jgi:probable HAF family extracellular repeat protein
MRHLRLFLPVLAACFLTSPVCFSQTVTYNVTDLGNLGFNSEGFFEEWGWWPSVAASGNGINSYGQVTGYANDENDAEHAFIYTDPTIVDLGALCEYGDSYGMAINDSACVAGYTLVGTSAYYHAFLHDGSTMNDLGTLGGSNSQAQGMNNDGLVVGTAQTASANWHAFLYDGSTMTDLLGANAGSNSVAYSINDSGKIVGQHFVDGHYHFWYNGQDYPYDADIPHAFLLDGSTLTDLGTLCGYYDGCHYSVATHINNQGQIVGSSTLDIGQHAFLYSNSTLTDLGSLYDNTPGTWDFSYANSINNNGQVVGYSYVNSYGWYHAFIHDGSTMQDLNDLVDPECGFTLEIAYDINDAGQIVGYGVDNETGEWHAILLTPVE